VFSNESGLLVDKNYSIHQKNYLHLGAKKNEGVANFQPSKFFSATYFKTLGRNSFIIITAMNVLPLPVPR
jgi:hypothetical protein